MRSYAKREAHKSNHYPLVAPHGEVSKIKERYEAFKKLLMTGETPPSFDEECWLRWVEPLHYDPITVKGISVPLPDLAFGGTGVTPNPSQIEKYWDLKRHWPDGSTPIDEVFDKLPDSVRRGKDREELRNAWREFELGRILGEYIDLKFIAKQHYDCDHP